MFEIDGIHPYAEATGLSAVFPVSWQVGKDFHLFLINYGSGVHNYTTLRSTYKIGAG